MTGKNIVINTHTTSAGTAVCVDDMIPRLQKIGYTVTHNDWDNYAKYDIAMFMGADSDIKKAKEQNPSIKTILMDPKLKKKRYGEIYDADLLLVSSIEQREALYGFNKNIFIYYMFPFIEPMEKAHVDKDIIKIVYNGNKQHLHAFYPTLTKALDNVQARTHKTIELDAIYNVQNLGKWKKGIPTKIKVNHIQWSEENQRDYINNGDIGLCPNVIHISRRRLFPFIFRNIAFSNIEVADYFTKPWRMRWIWNILGINPHDYILRFKNSTNPGRMYVFAMLGIPVVSDFAPSACNIIEDRKSGMITGSTEGLEQALLELIENPELRNTCSKNLKETMLTTYSKEKIFDDFSKVLAKL